MNSNTDNVIFLKHPHDSEQQNADESTGPAIFYQLPRSTQEEIKEVENEAVENQSEYDRRHQVAADVASLTRTQLRLNYPGAYSSWKNIKRRCKEGKGVLHPEFVQFPDFLLAVGPRPAHDYTVDRTNLDNPEYGPTNCRWGSKALQTANRRNTRYLTDSQGIRLTISAWTRRFGVPGKKILQRVDRDKWSVDDAVRPEPKSVPEKSQDKPSKKPLFPDAPPTHLQSMLYAFIQGLDKHHSCPIFLLEWKHLGALEYIHLGLVRCGVSPVHVVAMVVERWRRFANYKDAPRLPSLAYLRHHVMEAAMYYRNNGGKIFLDDTDEQVIAPSTPVNTDQEL